MLFSLFRAVLYYLKLYYQSHIFHSLSVFGAGADDIDSRRVYTAVTENIGEFGDVLLDTVEDTSEQVP